MWTLISLRVNTSKLNKKYVKWNKKNSDKYGAGKLLRVITSGVKNGARLGLRRATSDRNTVNHSPEYGTVIIDHQMTASRFGLLAVVPGRITILSCFISSQKTKACFHKNANLYLHLTSPIVTIISNVKRLMLLSYYS